MVDVHSFYFHIEFVPEIVYWPGLSGLLSAHSLKCILTSELCYYCELILCGFFFLI